MWATKLGGSGQQPAHQISKKFPEISCKLASQPASQPARLAGWLAGWLADSEKALQALQPSEVQQEA